LLGLGLAKLLFERNQLRYPTAEADAFDTVTALIISLTWPIILAVWGLQFILDFLDSKLSRIN